MLDDIHRQLLLVKERLREKEKLESMLKESRAMLAQETQKCQRHEQILNEEKVDVDHLEGLSLTGIFYSIIGTKSEKLEVEKQEFLAAKLKYEESKEAVQDIQQDVQRLESQLENLDNVEDDYHNLVARKEQLLSQANHQVSPVLLNLSEKLGDLQADQKELQEAVEAGQIALNSLEQVKSELRSAENWGTWDMLGGGTLTTLAKHSKIDAAKRQARFAQHKLRKFREELADADKRLHLSLDDIGGFSTFADYFFDGLIVDWMVQSKIQSASAACYQAIGKVERALSECRESLRRTIANIQATESERKRVVEEA
ncbi:MAG: hypothetical protein KDA80_12190 [Planctomycetaceae bacterium]|nr:hypothetical protein [Planctomycetaceae bacterium]